MLPALSFPAEENPGVLELDDIVLNGEKDRLWGSKLDKLYKSHSKLAQQYGAEPQAEYLKTEAGKAYSLIWKILGTQQIAFNAGENEFNHYFVNNNKLLGMVDNVVGGKTGYTDQAKGCMVLVTNKPSSEYLITVALGSNNRMEAIKQLLNWVNQAYIWQ